MNKLVNKAFSRDEHYLVRDPANSLRTGDIIEMTPGWRVSKNVRHVVTRILAPFGSRIEERPRVPSEEERIEEYMVNKRAKDERRWLRGKRWFDKDGKVIPRFQEGKKAKGEEDGEKKGKEKEEDKRRVESDVD